MNRLITYIYTTLYRIYTTITGQSEAIEIFKHNKCVLCVEVKTSANYSVMICCRKREFLRKFERSWFKAKIYTVFDVYCQIDEKAPEEIKSIFSITTTFPPMVSLYVDDKIQARILINAYLDMLKNRIANKVDLTNVTIH